MYSCKDSVDLLRQFLDGDMSDDQEKSLQEHLSACPPCVDFLKTYRATPGLCKRALARKMPEEMGQKLTEFLRAKAGKPTP
jgi:anti-sigma factor (TIGR02949 family)